MLLGSLPGGGHEAAPVPTSPVGPNRDRQDGHDPGKPLLFLAAIHARQDTTDDDVAKIKTGFIQMNAVMGQVVREGVGSNTVEALKLEVQQFRGEVQSKSESKLAEEVVQCFNVVGANDLAQKESLKLFEAMVEEEKGKLAKLQMELSSTEQARVLHLARLLRPSFLKVPLRPWWVSPTH